MGYNDKAEVVFVVKSVWTGVVASSRYVGKTRKYLYSQLKPNIEFLYKNSLKIWMALIYEWWTIELNKKTIVNIQIGSK